MTGNRPLPADQRPVVLIVGGGFAGLDAAKGLRDAPVSVILADRHNYHLFQPLLYQVATAVLSPADIASPIRHILRDQENAEVILDELVEVDLARRSARFRRTEVRYDFLVLATGATHSYFGHDDWQEIAPGLKTIDDALELRRRVLLAFEEAEQEEDEASRRGKLTFVVVGGGPTGVEMAGALKEIASRSIPHDFRYIDTTTARVVLVEARDRLLAGMPAELGRRARSDLERMGVEVRLDSRVTAIDPYAVHIGDERLPTENLIWAAGVQGSPVAGTLGAGLDPSGRVVVGPDLAVPGHPEVFVVGDLARASDPASGEAVPGLAPAAKQMGSHAAGIIRAEVGGRLASANRPPFRYRDKGTMATIGRFKAVAVIHNRKFGGLLAWLAWSFIHIYFLVGFRRRLFVMLSWIWNYVAFHKGARLITGYPEVRIKRPRQTLGTGP
jgi:NADH dehydrogenase